jgi:hypothetical protein
LFGYGAFNKMFSLENIPVMKDANFLENLKEYIECFIEGISKDNDFESHIDSIGVIIQYILLFIIIKLFIHYYL